MVLQELGSRLKRFGAVALALGLALSICGPAAAGIIGAPGDLYVSDDYLGGVWQYDGQTGDFVGVFASRGTRRFLGNAWGPDGNLYALSIPNTAGRAWDLDKYDGNTGAWLGTVVSHPNDGSNSLGLGLTFGPDGDIYVGDWWRAQVHRYQAGSFALKASYTAVSGDNFATPKGMTFGPNGNLMVCAGLDRVVQFDTSNDGLNLLGTFGLFPDSQQPNDLAWGPDGDLFVTGGWTGNVGRLDGTTGDYLGEFVPSVNGRFSYGVIFDDYGRMLVTFGDDVDGYRAVAHDAATGALLGDFTPLSDGEPGFMSIKPIPEPATIGLLLVGGLILGRRRA